MATGVSHLTDEQADALAVRLVEQLDGVPIGQALSILKDRAPLYLTDGHVVQVTNPRYQALADRAARAVPG